MSEVISTETVLRGIGVTDEEAIEAFMAEVREMSMQPNVSNMGAAFALVYNQKVRAAGLDLPMMNAMTGSFYVSELNLT